MASPPEVDESSPGPNENLYSLDSLPPEVREQAEKLQKRDQPVNILVIGPTGSGKSTLINALLGGTVAEVGHSGTAVTQEVKEYDGEFLGVKIKVYDTVGFFSAGGKSKRDIINEIKGKNEKFDLVLICLKLGERLDDIAKSLFSTLAQHDWLTPEMWATSIVVLTQADKFLQNESMPKDDDGRAKEIKSKMEEFKKYIFNFIPKNEHEKIPFCLTGKLDERKLPTTSDWLLDLWKSCIERCSKETEAFMAWFFCLINRAVESFCAFFKNICP